MLLDQVHVSVILAFLEFLVLVYRNVSHSSVINYLSAIKTKFSMFGLPLTHFMDPRLRYFNNLLSRNAPFRVALKAIIDKTMLQDIASQCDKIFMGQIFKAAYLLSFPSLGSAI